MYTQFLERTLPTRTGSMHAPEILRSISRPDIIQSFLSACVLMSDINKTPDELRDERERQEERIKGLESALAQSFTAFSVLQEREEQYRMLVENLPDVIWTADSDGQRVYVSPGWKRSPASRRRRFTAQARNFGSAGSTPMTAAWFGPHTATCSRRERLLALSTVSSAGTAPGSGSTTAPSSGPPRKGRDWPTACSATSPPASGRGRAAAERREVPGPFRQRCRCHLHPRPGLPVC